MCHTCAAPGIPKTPKTALAFGRGLAAPSERRSAPLRRVPLRDLRGARKQTGASGKLVADAYHAALALEHGCEWVTTDADFGRFPGLRVRHPLHPRAR